MALGARDPRASTKLDENALKGGDKSSSSPLNVVGFSIQLEMGLGGLKLCGLTV
jgi:hypothetical protein